MFNALTFDNMQANTFEQVEQKLKQYVDMVSDNKCATMVNQVDVMNDVYLPIQLVWIPTSSSGMSLEHAHMCQCVRKA